MPDPRPSVHPRHLESVGGPPPGVGKRPTRWEPREVDDLIRQFFESPFGMAQHDNERHELLTEILEVAIRLVGDPTHWDARLTTAVLVAEMPHQPHIPGRDRCKVPDLLRGFIGFCAAERGLDADAADDALGMVGHWSGGWSEPAVMAFDPWSTERRVLDELRAEIGTVERLWSLDTAPLLDEPFDRSALAPAAAEAVDEVLTLIDDACAVLVDPEVRIAARRLTAHVAAGDAGGAGRPTEPRRLSGGAGLVGGTSERRLRSRPSAGEGADGSPRAQAAQPGRVGPTLPTGGGAAGARPGRPVDARSGPAHLGLPALDHRAEGPLPEGDRGANRPAECATDST